jgi:glycerol-3-phosphate dehydrogenase
MFRVSPAVSIEGGTITTPRATRPRMLDRVCPRVGAVVAGAGSAASSEPPDNAMATAQRLIENAFKQYSGWKSRVARIIRCRVHAR